MVFKRGSNELFYSFSEISIELVSIKNEIKIHNIQIIVNDFNGFKNLCFRIRKFFVFFLFFLIFGPFLWLSLTEDSGPIGFIIILF